MTRALLANLLFTVFAVGIVWYIVWLFYNEIKQRKLALSRLVQEGITHDIEGESDQRLSSVLLETKLLPHRITNAARFIRTKHEGLFVVVHNARLTVGDPYARLVFGLVDTGKVYSGAEVAMISGTKCVGYADGTNQLEQFHDRDTSKPLLSWMTTQSKDEPHKDHLRLSARMKSIWTELNCDYIAVGGGLCVVGCLVDNENYYSSWKATIEGCQTVRSKLC